MALSVVGCLDNIQLVGTTVAYQGDESSKLADSAAAFKDRLEISVRLHSDLTVNDGQESSQISEFAFFSGWWFQTFFIFHNVSDNPSH